MRQLKENDHVICLSIIVFLFHENSLQFVKPQLVSNWQFFREMKFYEIISVYFTYRAIRGERFYLQSDFVTFRK